MHPQKQKVRKALMKTFEELGVSAEIRRAIEEMGYEQPMPVQEEVIPYLLGKNNDVVALAQTGTGKTAAFGLPLLQKIEVSRCEPQSLILCPTRELCLQIAGDLSDYSKYIEGLHVLPVYGGSSIESQIRALKRGVHIIVATPGRLIDLMERQTVSLAAVENVVLDEADEMLNMGFTESINTILAEVPQERNTLLFSATMSPEIARIAKNYLRQAKEITIGRKNESTGNVKHVMYCVHAKDKYETLKRIVDYYPQIYAIIFCRTRKETQEIADKLMQEGYNADSLHGELSQAQRDLVMQKFRVRHLQLLVATDVAARGLDVDDLTHVINYGLPDDIESYTHRSGRTGRAGKNGTSIAIVHTRERGKMRAIEKVIQKDFVEGKIPTAEEICKKQLYKVMDQIVKADVNEEEIEPFMADINRYFEYVDKEDIIKKIVSMEFGKFLAYYADAPEILPPSASSRGDRKERSTRKRGEGGKREPHKAEPGYQKLFINLGKTDGFYPGEIMQFLNRNIKGRQEVGHIDLLDRICYIEVPEKDATKVMRAIDGTTYKGRSVRCNDADDTGRPAGKQSGRGSRGQAGKSSDRTARGRKKHDENDDFGKFEKKSKRKNNKADNGGFNDNGNESDWRQFFRQDDVKLVGEEPDFSEEGWARRRPKKS